MAPSTWATAEQVEYLRSRVEEYCTFKASRKYDTFWRSLDQEWFEKWPERLALFPERLLDAPLTPDENKLLGTAISKRKDQLQTWYRWTTGKSKRNRSALSQPSSFDLLLDKKGSRRLSKAEIYYSEFSDRVHARIQGASKDYCDRGIRLNTAKSCAKELLACEDETTKTLIDGLYENQKVTNDDSGTRETDPESIRRAIDNLPYVLDAFAKMIKKRTGYTTSFVCAGPDPTRNWAITLLFYHPDEIEGVGSFSSQYPVSEEHKYLQAYQDFADILLSEDMRKAKMKEDNENCGGDLLDSSRESYNEGEQSAQPGDDVIHMFPPDGITPSHAPDTSTSSPPCPVYQTDASTPASSAVTTEPLTSELAILPPADPSLQPMDRFTGNFPLSGTSVDPDIFGDVTLCGTESAAYGIPWSFTSGPGGISFSQAMNEAIQEFNALNQVTSNSGLISDSVPSNGVLQWTFPDATATPEVPVTDPLVTNAPCSTVSATLAKTNPVSSTTVPSTVALTHCNTDTGGANSATALPVASIHHLPIPSTVDTQPSKQKKHKSTPRKKNSPVPVESNPAVPATAYTKENIPTMQPSPPAGTAAKRVRKKSTRNELANAIGTNMATFVGKENIPPEDCESLAVQKRKQTETNSSPNKRVKKSV